MKNEEYASESLELHATERIYENSRIIIIELSAYLTHSLLNCYTSGGNSLVANCWSVNAIWANDNLLTKLYFIH